MHDVHGVRSAPVDRVRDGCDGRAHDAQGSLRYCDW